MNRSPGFSRFVRRHSHTHSEERAPSLSARFRWAVLLGLSGASVLPLIPIAVTFAQGGGGSGAAVADDPKPQQPAPTPPRTVEDLVRALGDGDYRVREEASRALLERGEAALPALRQGLESPDPELRRRSGELIDAISGDAAQHESAPPADGRRFRDRPEFADPDLEEALRRIETLFGRFGGGAGAGEPPRPTAPLSGEFARRMQELEERFRERFPELRSFPMPFEPFAGRAAEEGRSEGRSSSRIQIWRDGQRVFDSSHDSEFAHAPQLGVLLENVPPALRAHLPIPEGQGLLVGEVAPGSRAARAGLETYDVILTCGGTPVGTVGELRRCLREAAGKELELGILQRGESRSVRVQLSGESF